MKIYKCPRREDFYILCKELEKRDKPIINSELYDENEYNYVVVFDILLPMLFSKTSIKSATIPEEIIEEFHGRLTIFELLRKRNEI